DFFTDLYHERDAIVKEPGSSRYIKSGISELNKGDHYHARVGT
ncbi:hypothetical protein LCGC14_3084390, partial [marine sediment metagenome]